MLKEAELGPTGVLPRKSARQIIRERVLGGLDRVRQQGKKLGRPRCLPRSDRFQDASDRRQWHLEGGGDRRLGAAPSDGSRGRRSRRWRRRIKSWTAKSLRLPICYQSGHGFCCFVKNERKRAAALITYRCQFHGDAGRCNGPVRRMSGLNAIGSFQTQITEKSIKNLRSIVQMYSLLRSLGCFPIPYKRQYIVHSKFLAAVPISATRAPPSGRQPCSAMVNSQTFPIASITVPRGPFAAWASAGVA